MRGRVGLVVGVLVAGIALLGCSGSDETGDQVVTIDEVAATTEAATTARMRVEFTYDDTSTQVTEGVIDFRTGDFEFHFSGFGPPGGVRTVGGEVYIHQEDPASGTGPWFHAPAFSQDVPFLSFDPVAVAERVTAAATDVTPLGSGTVRGAATSSYRLDIPSGLEDEPVLGGIVVGPSTVTLDVDGAGRLRRLVIEPNRSAEPVAPELPDEIHTAEGGYEEFSEIRTVLELWDFGVEVDLVAPDPADVVEWDDPEAHGVFDDGLSDGEVDDAPFDADLHVPELTGPFALTAAGAWRDLTWEVWEAPATDGRTCRTFEIDGPDVASLEVIPYGGWPAHDGVMALCHPDSDAGFGFVQAAELLSSGPATADAWYMEGRAAPDVLALEIELADARDLRVPVDPTSGVWVLFDDREVRLTSVVARTVDGQSIACDTEPGDTVGSSYFFCDGPVGR